jgi:polyhydroxybutyrate depolymerase
MTPLNQDYLHGMKSYRIILSVTAFIILSFSQNIFPGQTETGRFTFEDRERNYEVYLPQNFQSNMPVVFALHGGTEAISWFKNYTLFNEVSDTSRFIIVYPCGIGRLWNMGIRRGIMNADTTVNDVGFISALIDTIHARYAIDLQRIYCCGFSMGGAMSYRLACELAHRFAAFACVGHKLNDISASLYTKIRPLPILHIHGTNDGMAAYGKGPGNSWTVNETLDFWIQKNDCALEPDTISLPDLDTADNTTIDKFSYTDCTGSASILFYKVINGGHSWPGCNPDITYGSEGNKNYDINANVEIWNFFKNYENPLVNLAFAKSKEVTPRYLSLAGDSLIINASLNNPENHSVTVNAFIQGVQSALKDSVQLFDDGQHHDGQAADYLFGGSKWLSGLDEDIFEVTLRTTDLDQDITTGIYHPSCFTTIGPVVFDTLTFADSETAAVPGEHHKIYLSLKNTGSTATATGVKATLTSLDLLLTVPDYSRSLDDIAAGETATTTNYYRIGISQNCPEPCELPMLIQITSNNHLFWTDTCCVYVGSPTAIKTQENNHPNQFALYPNYPNPFNPSTTILFDLPEPGEVTLRVFTLLGEEVETLIRRNISAGSHQVLWNAGNHPGGVYLVRLEAGGFVQTRKMILMK